MYRADGAPAPHQLYNPSFPESRRFRECQHSLTLRLVLLYAHNLMHKRTALLNAVLFFVVWLAILYAGADQPPPPGFIFVVLLDLVAAGVVYWRVPFYLAWIASRRRNALLFVVLDGLVAGLAFAALPLAARWWLGGGEPSVAPTMADSLIWLAVVGVVGALNAVAIYLANWGAFWFAARRKR